MFGSRLVALSLSFRSSDDFDDVITIRVMVVREFSLAHHGERDPCELGAAVDEEP